MQVVTLTFVDGSISNSRRSLNYIGVVLPLVRSPAPAARVSNPIVAAMITVPARTALPPRAPPVISLVSVSDAPIPFTVPIIRAATSATNVSLAAAFAVPVSVVSPHRNKGTRE